jgi:hypothetical protein
MGLGIFFIEDIRNALLAADEATSATARICSAMGGDPVTLRTYMEGYSAALHTVALAFGIAPEALNGRRIVETARMLPIQVAEINDVR